MFKMVQKAIRTKIRAYLFGLSAVEVVSIVSLFGAGIVSIMSWRGKEPFFVIGLFASDAISSVFCNMQKLFCL